MWFDPNQEPQSTRECEMRYRMAVSRLAAMAPSLQAQARAFGPRAAATLVPDIEQACLGLEGSWSGARGLDKERAVAMDAERLLRQFGEEALRRNAAEVAEKRRTELDTRFAAILSAYDRCIGEVEKNVPWYEFLGGPLFVTADAYIRRKETETARNDRKNLLAKWSAAKTDAERAEILKLAERWYEATRFGLNGCQGIVPPLGDSMVAEAKNVATNVAETVKHAGLIIADHVGPILLVALGLGALLVLRH